MRSLQTVIKSMCAGASIGVALAIALITLDSWSGRPADWGGFIDRALVTLCPLFVLGFSGGVKSMASLVLITLLGNAFLYGALFALIAVGVELFRRFTHKPS